MDGATYMITVARWSASGWHMGPQSVKSEILRGRCVNVDFQITFLGTGGGRHTTIYQTRSTGGLLVRHDGRYIHMDPGPGALNAMHLIHHDPGITDSVVISHCHPDHYSDAPSVIEGMTHGGWKRRGHIYGSRSVIEGLGKLGPALSPYHLGLTDGVKAFEPGDVIDMDGLMVDITRAVHNDPTNVGFIMHTDHGTVSYLSDTEYHEDVGEQYKGTRVLILPVTTPLGNIIKGHMSTDGAIEICKQVKPELCIFIHLGIVMLQNDPDGQAALCERESGVRTVIGQDLMTLDVGEELVLGTAKTYPPEEFWVPDWCPSKDFVDRHPK